MVLMVRYWRNPLLLIRQAARTANDDGKPGSRQNHSFPDPRVHLIPSCRTPAERISIFDLLANPSGILQDLRCQLHSLG